MVATVASEKALLKKIVEAQVAAGYRAWEFILEEGDYEHKGDGEFDSAEDSFHVLGVLLDTKGCKAIYKFEWLAPSESRYHLYAVHDILDAWNCGKGNNTYAALMKAVSLLPK